MRLAFVLLAAICSVQGFAQTAAERLAPKPGYYKQLTPDRWKDRVATMLKADAENPPSTRGIVFVGSATIAGWDVKHYFPQYRTVNRGIGGSLISESTYYADQLVVPLNPSTIVFYSGDNDTAYGMTPDMVTADFRKFVAKIHRALPKTQIVAISIRPSIARLGVWDVVNASNTKIQQIAESDPQLAFVDLNDLLLTPDGKPRRELLREDLHHLNKDGFDLVSPWVGKSVKEAESRYWRDGIVPTGQ